MEKTSVEQRKQMLCKFMKEDFYVPMKEKELAIMMQVDAKDRESFKEVLKQLLLEGKIEISKRGKYSISEKQALVGTFISHIRGFGFVRVENVEQDYYIPEDKTGNAYHQDKVLIRELPNQQGKRIEAEVVEILEHQITSVVGTFQKSEKFGFVIPDDPKISEDIFVPIERSKGAMTGHKVVAELTYYGSEQKNKKAEGKIVEILGHINDPGVDILALVKAFDIPCEFPQKVLNQVERVSQEVSKEDIEFRYDARGLQTVTIDGEDAKDLDDAISLKKTEKGYELVVHIADVTNYVQEHSALDYEALKRGTSVYLVDRVIPMLPHALSNGICSLNEGVDRLALSCFMELNEYGAVVDYSIKETVINVDRRMSYTSVNKIVALKDEEEMKEYEELVPMFLLMEEVSNLIRSNREKRGGVDFDFKESKIIVDENGFPISIKEYDRNIATKIIEDFMLLANETVAEHFYWMELPFVYRIHENPDIEKVNQLNLFIKNFGYYLKATKEDIHPKEFQKLLEKVSGTKEEMLISRLILRSMKQAKYTMDCVGHFGLACKYYTHFTSPIRRYPDLQIHRIIKEQLRGKMTPKRIEHYSEILTEVCNQSSKMERRAEEAERETNKMKKAEYMSEHIGEQFEGMISGVTSWGIYVELSNTIEGMVSIAAIPGDYYIYDENNYEMVGESTGKKFKLGDPVVVRVKAADKLMKTIDFDIVEE